MKIRIKVTGLFIAVTTTLTACGGGSAGTATAVSTMPTAKTMAEAISLADKDGTLPALNRDATIAGPDDNANGVRDDLDGYIAGLPDTSLQKAALSQMSASLVKSMLTDTTNKSAILTASNGIAAAAACLHTQYESSVASKKSNDMEKLTINTRARFTAYDKFSAALDGMTFVLPQGDGCAN